MRGGIEDSVRLAGVEGNLFDAVQTECFARGVDVVPNVGGLTHELIRKNDERAHVPGDQHASRNIDHSGNQKRRCDIPEPVRAVNCHNDGSENQRDRRRRQGKHGNFVVNVLNTGKEAVIREQKLISGKEHTKCDRRQHQACCKRDSPKSNGHANSVNQSCSDDNRNRNKEEPHGHHFESGKREEVEVQGPPENRIDPIASLGLVEVERHGRPR